MRESICSGRLSIGCLSDGADEKWNECRKVVSVENSSRTTIRFDFQLTDRIIVNQLTKRRSVNVSLANAYSKPFR